MISFMDLLASFLALLAFGFSLPSTLYKPSKIHLILLMLLAMTALVNGYSGFQWFKFAVSFGSDPALLTESNSFNLNKVFRPMLASIWLLALFLLTRTKRLRQ